jgi:hypothetical protein
MALPDDLGVAAFGKPLASERAGRDPAPGVGADHSDAALEGIERRLAADPTPGVDVARLPVLPARGRIDDDDRRGEHVVS